MKLCDALLSRRSCRNFSSDFVPYVKVKNILQMAIGRTSPEGCRAAPSAGGLYPLRFHLVAARIEGLSPGLYGMDPVSGALERQREENMLCELEAAALENQPWVGNCAFALAISGDLASAKLRFADQPPLRERGFRYLLIEAGATAQNVLLQMTAVKLGAVLVGGFYDDDIATALRLEQGVAPISLICAGIPLTRQASYVRPD